MDKFGHPIFNELVKDIENTRCFDCNKQPAQWASINNGIYLCISCSGNHRGYGVDISFMRSIVLDQWSETQVNLMKNGGNKACDDFLKLYGINKNDIKNKQNLYESKIMHFYRKLLKNKSLGIKDDKLVPPSKESSLMLNSGVNGANTAVKNEDRFSSVGSEPKVEEEDENSFKKLLTEYMNDAVDSGKSIAKKVSDLNIGHKILDAGEKILNKGTEISQSETVQNFAKKANDSINFLIGKLIGSKIEEQENAKNENNNKEENSNMENSDVKITNNKKEDTKKSNTNSNNKSDK